MTNRFSKIAVAFVALAMLPLAYVIFELSSLSNNERIIRQIYQSQLDAILFSVNQYADDVISNWANKISNSVADGERDLSGLTDVQSIAAVFISSFDEKEVIYGLHSDTVGNSSFRIAGRNIRENQAERIERLFSYHQAGFRKTEPVDTLIADRYVPLLFVPHSAAEGSVAIMFLDIKSFVDQTLGPKMEAVSGEGFVLIVRKKRTEDIFYTTARDFVARSDASFAAPREEGTARALWLIPGYEVVIATKGPSLDELVWERTATSISILTVVSVILLFGVFFLYRNMRSQFQLTQAKAEFVSNVSHEIKTPLSLISMYTETLQLGRVPEEKKQEYYEIISKETSRLSGIVNRILNFSKADANRKQYIFRLVDLNEICEEVIETYRLQLSVNGFQFHTFLSGEMLCVECDREAVAEALVNLLDNAVKYSKKEKEITITTRSQKGWCLIEVKDKGIGIPKAYQKHIFEQFYRAPMGNVHDTKGSGLGLALVRRTMDAHAGKVDVSSELDKGSTFRLWFPINKNHTA